MTCQCPLPTFKSDRPFTPFGPDTCAPFEARRGGQMPAQAPLQLAVFGLSSAKRYRVRPDDVVSTVPIPAILAVEILTSCRWCLSGVGAGGPAWHRQNQGE